MVKSSVNPFIGEFNSLFVSNMTFMPTLMKFAMSSVHPVNTDSFFRMVKESFTSSRQIVENGGGMDLYLISSYLNKQYCESIYHTSDSGVNSIPNVRSNRMPYHMGLYPIFNPSLMILFGPEFHNYYVYKRYFDDMNETEKTLFAASHKFIKGGVTEAVGEFEEGDTIMGGLLRIEANIGPVRQLNRLREYAEWGRDDLTNMIMKDPLVIIKQPKNIDDIRFKMYQKLYTTGSAEGLKIIASSIYYGRVSASVSAKCYHISGSSFEDKMTYMECVEKLLQEKVDTNLDDQIKFLYPKHKDYDLFLFLERKVPSLKSRNPFEIQTVQKISTHKINTKLTQPVADLLEYKWLGKKAPPNLESKINRDFEIMKLHFPSIKDTVQETLDQFKGDTSDKTKHLLLLILKLYSLRDRTFKGILYGPGSNDVSLSYRLLWEHNYSLSHRSDVNTNERIAYKREVYEDIFVAYNHEILKTLANSKCKSPWDRLNRNDLDYMMMDPSINKNTKKRILMVALSKGCVDNIEGWTKKTDMILHTWNIRQYYNKGIWKGAYNVTLFCGSNKMNFSYNENVKELFISKTDFDDPSLLYSFFKEFKSLMDFEDTEFKKCKPGNWIIKDNKILKVEIGDFQFYDFREMDEVNLMESSLIITPEKILLNDKYGYKIYQVDTGLIPAVGKITDDEDFSFMGITFNKLLEMSVFRYNFHALYLDKEDALNMIDNLNCDKPLVSKQTIERLNLRNWEHKIESKSESKTEMEDVSHFLDSMIEYDMTEINITITPEEDDLFSTLIDTDLVKSLLTASRIHFPRKMFMTVMNLKYDLICHQLLSEMKINKTNLHAILKLFHDSDNLRFIMYSLISLYDRTYENDGQKSPGQVVICVNSNFTKKFSIDDNSSDEITDIID